MMKNTILLTGISGYIGLHCAKELLDAGYNVRGSIRNQVKGQEVLDTLTAASVDTTNLTLIELDLTSNRGWDEAAAGCEFVMHVASPFVLANPKEPKDLISPAIDGTLRALRAAKKAGVKRLVLTSSILSMMGSIKRAHLTQVTGLMSMHQISAPTPKVKLLQKKQLGILSVNRLKMPQWH